MIRPVIPAPSTRVVEQHTGTVLSGEALKLANDRLQEVAVGQLEELLDAEIPCGGLKEECIRRECDRAAQLRGHSHPCVTPLISFKCIECWQIWYRSIMSDMARFDGIKCEECRELFRDPSVFVDYRPF